VFTSFGSKTEGVDTSSTRVGATDRRAKRRAEARVKVMPRLPNWFRSFASQLRQTYFLSLLATVFAVASPAAAQDSDWSDQLSLDKEELRAGEYEWFEDADSSMPLRLVVSLSQQRVYVYRGGVVIAHSSISSGRKGYATPTGVFTILERKRKHISNLYDAPMPYMLRLTWDGIALHGGDIPGYRASHGCIRLPMAFSRELFAVARAIETVVVTNDPVVEGMYDDSHTFATLP
jgi:hypothetical protein